MAGESVTTKGPRGLPADLRTRDVQGVDADRPVVTPTQTLEAPPTTRVTTESSGSVSQTRSTGADAVNVFAINRTKRGRVRQPRLLVVLVKAATALQTRAFRAGHDDLSGDLEAVRRQRPSEQA